MRSYELMYILDPTLDEDGSTALVGKIEDLMTKQGVEIENTEPWGKRRLAYRVKGHWEGNYVLSNLKAAPAVIPEMERRLRNTDGVLRFLTVRVDEEQAKAERRKARNEEKDVARRERKVKRAREKEGAEAASGPRPAAVAPTPTPTPPPAPAPTPTPTPAASPAASESTPAQPETSGTEES